MSEEAKSPESVEIIDDEATNDDVEMDVAEKSTAADQNDEQKSDNDDSIVLDDSTVTGAAGNKSTISVGGGNKSINKSLNNSATKIDKNLQKAIRIEMEKKRIEEKVNTHFKCFYNCA
jgi:hypothetical protein